jgi:hypothetical protein
MVLYVVNVPNPPPGVDWQYTVPGQYIEDIVSVTATLATTANPTTAVNGVTGNAYPATYQSAAQLTWQATGPYGGTSNYAVTVGAPINTIADIAQGASTTDFNRATFSIGAWAKIPAATTGRFPIFASDQFDLGGHARGYMFQGHQSAGQEFLSLQWKGGEQLSTGTFPGGTWTHVAVTWDTANIRFYKNGVLDSTFAAAVLFDAISNPVDLGGNQAANLEVFQGSLGGIFYNDSVLTAGQILAYVTASATSAAAYQTAVLADSPRALWMMNEGISTSGRTPSLAIGNGITNVGLYTPGIPPASSGSPFTYSWLTTLSSNTHAGGTSTITAAIPDLILPAGYTIGTYTPDIAPTDQWSNIVIWWDSTFMDGNQNLQPYDFTGACLQYHQIGTP